MQFDGSWLETKFEEICFRKCLTPICLKHCDESKTWLRFRSVITKIMTSKGRLGSLPVKNVPYYDSNASIETVSEIAP